MAGEAVPFHGEDQSVNVGAHVCAMHDDPGRVLRTLGLVFRVGLERDERCVYIAPEEAAREVRGPCRTPARTSPKPNAKGA
jgi:hypothetical protein